MGRVLTDDGHPVHEIPAETKMRQRFGRLLGAPSTAGSRIVVVAGSVLMKEDDQRDAGQK
jgi:hypothetical protein